MLSSHLLDNINLLIQQSSNEGSKAEEIYKKQEVLKTVAPYDTLLW